MIRLLLCLALLLVTAQPIAEQIVLQKNNFEHVHFRRIQPTIVTFNTDALKFDVNKSASFLLLAFEDIKTVTRVSFEWKASGVLKKNSVEHETTRKGDDAWLRIGVIHSGQPNLVPEPLLPRWVKKVRDTLIHPSDKMTYLIPDARHAPGQTWRSPFSANIEMVSVASRHTRNNWQQVAYTFTHPQQTVGLWIMADGDNTASVFRSQLRNLIIE